jgi:CheY-like chemotaxis protein
MGQPPLAELSGIHVLVAEDNDDARTILRSLLSYLGAFVSTAASAQHALDILAQIKVDAVVCDVQLGDNDALWLIQHTGQYQPATPFIAISAQDYDEDEMRRAGFSAMLTKPVRQDLLVGQILAALGR